MYSLLDDDGSGSLTVHEMIDLFDGVNNDALLINDCNDAPMPHHWLGDGYCDDGSDVDDGGGDFNCNIFLCDDSDCDEPCRVVTGRGQVEVKEEPGRSGKQRAPPLDDLQSACEICRFHVF